MFHLFMIQINMALEGFEQGRAWMSRSNLINFLRPKITLYMNWHTRWSTKWNGTIVYIGSRCFENTRLYHVYIENTEI